MSNAEGLTRAAAELALAIPGRMAPHAPGRESFQRDYGPQRRKPNLEASRFHDSWGWDSDGDRGNLRKSRVDNSYRGSNPTLWGQVRATLCPGTMVFVVCVAITTFIVVV